MEKSKATNYNTFSPTKKGCDDIILPVHYREGMAVFRHVKLPFVHLGHSICADPVIHTF
jgi:hypothetical protein